VIGLGSGIRRPIARNAFHDPSGVALVAELQTVCKAEGHVKGQGGNAVSGEHVADASDLRADGF